MMDMKSPPRDILIVGSGVFGLSTAWALTKRPFFNETKITVVDDARGGPFPPGDCASVDSSRIVRADYADAAYAALAAAAQREWRKQGSDDGDELGAQGRYSESGLLLAAYREEAAAAAGRNKVGKKTAWAYSRASFRNVSRIAESAGERDKVRELSTAREIDELIGMGERRGDGRLGDWGYINELSGWADAGKGMTWLFERVEETGRVTFVDARVDELETQGDRVVGVKLDRPGSAVIRADIVMVAAGAWTGSLVDLRGRVQATGQPLGYIDITEEEFQQAAALPVILNLSSGLFIIPPQERVLKVARHSFGYLNPVTVTKALPPSPSHARKPILVSRPLTQRDGASHTRLPRSADEALRRALRDLTPVRGLEDRPWKQTRLCWYADTSDGDWLVDWHPGWKGLFVATGDSGHAFKFLPVLGEKCVDCLLGKGGELAEKWKWKTMDEDDDDEADYGEVEKISNGEAAAAAALTRKFRGLITDDGSRAGEAGLILQEELDR